MRKYQEIAEPKKKEKKQKRHIAWKVISALMPYILSIAFVFVLFSLFGFLDIKVSEDKVVKIGTVISAPLKILFSGAGSVFFTLMLIYHAIVWKYDVKHGICVRRIICSVITVISVSAIQHIIEYNKYHETFDIHYVYDVIKNGLTMHGGGLFGSLLGDFLIFTTHEFIAYAILFVLIVFMGLQMFNITPAYMVKALFAKLKGEKDEEKNEPKPKKEKLPPEPKGKKVDVFDDSRDFQEKEAEKRLQEAAKNAQTAAVDIRELIMKNEEDADEDETDEFDLLYQVSKDQLQNYDEDYIRQRKEREENLTVDVSQITSNEFGHVYTELSSKDNKETEIDPRLQNVTNFDEYFALRMQNEEEEKNNSSLFTEEYLKKNAKEEKAAQVKVEEPKIEEIEEIDDDFEKNIITISSFDDANTIDDEDDLSPLPVATAAAAASVAVDATLTAAEAALAATEVDAASAPLDEFGYLDKLIDNAQKIVDPNKEAETLVGDFDDNSNYIPLDFQGKNKAPQPPKKKAIKRNYKFPPIQFLQEPIDNSNTDEVKAELQGNAKTIVETLNEFKVWTKISDIIRGPTVTRYELVPEPGVRVRAIAGLSDDIKLKLAAEDIRMECPVPGKSVVGIEVPNKVTSMVYLRDLIDCPQFKKAKGKLTCALGKSISGENIYVDVEKAPHLLVAGSTGMGKSVCINSLLVSLLYRATPDDVRLILVDPKKVEFSSYDGIPHLLVPVVVDPKKALGALQWAVTEMENRFEIARAAGAKNITEFNERVEKGYDADKMTSIVIVIDELADLKMQVPDIDQHITRLTQKARAAGIHVIIGTQRPSVNVITGLIKSNIPSRVSFKVPSQIDSRTVLDEIGAEKLVSRGDMLVKIVGSLYPVRVQGSYVSTEEIEEVISYWKENSPAIYDEDVMHQIDVNASKMGKGDKGSSFDDYDDDEDDDGGELDASFYDALELATEMGKISSSFLQRKLRLGFQRAARIIDQMEDCGYIGEQNGSKPRDVLITKDDFHEIMMRRKG